MLKALLDYNSKENIWLRAHKPLVAAIGTGLALIPFSYVIKQLRKELN